MFPPRPPVVWRLPGICTFLELGSFDWLDVQHPPHPLHLELTPASRALFSVLERVAGEALPARVCDRSS